jgi:hypothetical protein
MDTPYDGVQMFQPQPHAAMYEDSPVSANEHQNILRNSADDEGLQLYTDGFDSSGGIRGRFSNSKYSTRRSMDDLLIATDARMNRIANAESAMRQEIYKECTFRPNIKDLPHSYGAKKELDVPFLTRVEKWQKEKDLLLQKKASTLANGEKAACTFHPKINQNSEKAARLVRGLNANEHTSERLFKNSELSQAQRVQAIQEIKEREEQALEQECTFQPELLTKFAQVHQGVQSKFTLPVTPKVEQVPSDLKNCTFTPKVSICCYCCCVCVWSFVFYRVLSMCLFV